MINEFTGTKFGNITPECVLVMLLGQLIAYREQHGPKKCRKRGFGAVRRAVGDPLPSEVGCVSRLLEGQRQAANVLAAECRRCGACKLARAETAA